MGAIVHHEHAEAGRAHYTSQCFCGDGHVRDFAWPQKHAVLTKRAQIAQFEEFDNFKFN